MIKKFFISVCLYLSILNTVDSMAMYIVPKCAGCQQEIKTQNVKPCNHDYHQGCLRNLVVARNQLRKDQVVPIKCSGDPGCIILDTFVNEILGQAITLARSGSPEPLEICSICKAALNDDKGLAFELQPVIICDSPAKEIVMCDLVEKEIITEHRAHRGCAIKWALINGTCPVDRTPVVFKYLIPPLTKQQQKQFYGAELSDAMFMGIYSCVLFKIANIIFTNSDNFNGWCYGLCMTTFILQPVFRKLHARLVNNFEYRIVRRFPDIFWKKWAVRVAGLSLGVGGTMLIGTIK